MRNLRRRSGLDGFTIIELLVVVTVIVVLLALLTPSLDKAIYQTELATCAAGLDGVASGAISYALNHQRSYPAPRLFRTLWLRTSQGPQESGTDFRPVIEDFIFVNALNDPLSKEVDLVAPFGNQSYVFSTTTLWAGWGYENESQGMRKLGDRIEWTINSTPPRTFRFSLLAADRYTYRPDPGTVASHPDSQGVLANNFGQDDEFPGASPYPTDTFTYSRWERSGVACGLLDLNFAFSDGSVERYADVDGGDERLTAVPARADGVAEAWMAYVPTD